MEPVSRLFTRTLSDNSNVFQLMIHTTVNTGPLRGKSQVNFGPRCPPNRQIGAYHVFRPSGPHSIAECCVTSRIRFLRTKTFSRRLTAISFGLPESSSSRRDEIRSDILSGYVLY